MSWYHTVGQGLLYVPAFVAVLGILAGLRAVYRRTFGRRRNQYSRLARLGTNAQVTFFTSVLGEPPALRRSLVSGVRSHRLDGDVVENLRFSEYIWVDREFYVHAYADEDDTVVTFSITTRTDRFHPRLHSPGWYYERRGRVMRWLGRPYRLRPLFEVTLAKTTFAELGEPGGVDMAAGWLGNRPFHYYEARWYGTGGQSQWYVFSINDAGHAQRDELRALMGGGDFAYGFDPDHDPPYSSMKAWKIFRGQMGFNTYTVVGPPLWLDTYPGVENLARVRTVFGVSSNRVQTLP